MHCNLRPPDVEKSLFLTNCVLCMCTNCHFVASSQNVEIAVRLSDSPPPDFLKECNNLAVRQRFHAVTLTLNVCSTSGCHVIKLCTKYERHRTTRC